MVECDATSLSSVTTAVVQSGDPPWVQSLVEPPERCGVEEAPGARLAVVAPTLGHSEPNELFVRDGQGVEELRGAGADVVAFGVGDKCWAVDRSANPPSRYSRRASK